jgi:hypothetical protein
LIVVNRDNLGQATDLHIVVAGSSNTEWHPKVRGLDTDGCELSVAYYEIAYTLKADATKRAREMLAVVKRMSAA